MVHIYKDTKINYEVIGQGSTPLVFLHGWGGSIDSFKYLSKILPAKYKALYIDFPPFGKSDEPACVFNIFDYSEMVKQILDKEGISKPIIIGHSFGGRVGLILANECVAEKLVLIDSAGLIPRRGIKYRLKIGIYKLRKLLKINTKNAGSKDYQALSPIMKKIFVNIVNTNLENCAININVPTLIFWGEKDKETPTYMAKRLNKLINGSELVVCKGAGHFSYIDDHNTFINVLLYFLEE